MPRSGSSSYGWQALLAVTVLLSTTLPARPETLPIRTYTTADGLPNRSVRDLLETRAGIYWIATGEGLSSFNPSGKSLRLAN